MQANEFYTKYANVARLVESGTGIPAELELAFMSWETDYANNGTSKNNNMTGITKGSAGRDFVAGAYAGYNSLERYAADRIRLLNLNMAGYPAVVAAARSKGSYEAITKAHNASGWSEADYNVSTIVQRAEAAKKVIGGSGYSAGKPVPAPAVCPHCQQPVYLRSV